MRQPDENREELWAWLLQRNARMYGVAFSIDAVGDVYLTGRVPLAGVDRGRAGPAARLGAHLRRRVLRHDAGDRLRHGDPAGVGLAGQARRVAGQPAGVRPSLPVGPSLERKDQCDWRDRHSRLCLEARRELAFSQAPRSKGFGGCRGRKAARRAMRLGATLARRWGMAGHLATGGESGRRLRGWASFAPLVGPSEMISSVPRPQQILAISPAARPPGTPADRRSALLDHAISLTGVRRAKVCFVTTAIGDDPAGSPASTPCWLPPIPPAEPRPAVPHAERRRRAVTSWSPGPDLGQRRQLANLLALWRVHRRDEFLRERRDAGVVLGGGGAGRSAGTSAAPPTRSPTFSTR